MCGLAGYFGTGTANPEKIKMLLVVNEERGTHSTGLFGKKLIKEPVKASKFIQHPSFNYIAESNIVLGHTRYATGGALTAENAHPFKINEDLVGTHNGWLVNTYEIEKKYGVKEDVDSHALYQLIGKLDDPLAFTKAEGAMALAFKYKNKMYLYRRESRPLFIGKADNGYYYSSILESLRMIGIPHRHCYTIIPHNLYVFDPNDGSFTYEAVEKPRVEITEKTYMASWEVGVDKSLVEELTGKKHIPVLIATGGTGMNTTNLGTGTKLTDSERVAKIERETSISGQGLSFGIKEKIYEFYEEERHCVVRASHPKFVNKDSQKKLYSFDKRVISEEAMRNGLVWNNPIKTERVYPAAEKGIHVEVNLHGISQFISPRKLDSGCFVLTSRPFMERHGSDNEKKAYGGASGFNSFEVCVDAVDTGDSTSRYYEFELFPTMYCGLSIKMSVMCRYGHVTVVDVYIPLELLDEVGNLLVNGKASDEIDLSTMSRDVTRLFSIMEMNQNTAHNGWETLPVMWNDYEIAR